MALKKIKEDLQRRDSTYAHREHSKTPYNEWQKIDQESKLDISIWQKTRDALMGTRWRATFAGAMVLAALFIAVFVFVSMQIYQRAFFHERNLTLSVSIPEQVDSNRQVEIIFSYQNNNRASLHDVIIDVDLGEYFIADRDQENFQYKERGIGVVVVDDIPGKSEGSVSVTGHFIAPKNEVENLSGIVRYSPKYSTRRVEKKAQVSTTVTSSPLYVDIHAEQEVVNGNAAAFVITYANNSDQIVDGVHLVFLPPDGFTMYSGSGDELHEKRIWSLGTIKPQQEGEILVTGVVNGHLNDVRRFEVQLVVNDNDQKIVYASNAQAMRIVESPIKVIQEIVTTKEGAVKPGSNLKYFITFQNVTDVPLRDVVLTLYLDSKAVVYDSIKLPKGGFYDQSKRQIIWKASDISALRLLNPSDRGTATFSMDIERFLPAETHDDKDFTITTLIAAESKDIPSAVSINKNVFSSTKIAKVAAKVLYDVDVKHLSGPLPLRVGQKTAYRVTLQVGSVNNDLKDVIVRGSLPTGVNFIRPEGDRDRDIIFNTRTNEFEWTIGFVEHGTGVYDPHRTTSFDIEVIPSINQVGGSILLIKNVVLRGRDVFADEDVTALVKKITTEKAGGSYIMGVVRP